MGGGVCFVGLLFPDLRPKPDLDFEFVAAPTDGPAGCVLWKHSSGLTDGSRGHQWCYLDPKLGYAVVRSESFHSSLDDNAASPAASAKLFVRTLDGFERSLQGWWHPARVVETRVTVDPATGERKSDGDPAVTSYHFDFSAEIPDELFVIDPPPKAEPADK